MQGKRTVLRNEGPHLRPPGCKGSRPPGPGLCASVGPGVLPLARGLRSCGQLKCHPSIWTPPRPVRPTNGLHPLWPGLRGHGTRRPSGRQARGPGGRRGRTRAGGMRAGGGATQLQLASAWGPPQEACLPAASPTLASQIREVQRLNGQRARINPKGRWTRVWGRADPRPLQNSSPCPGTAGWDGPQWAAPCYWQEARAGRGGPRYARSPSSVRRGCCFGNFRKCD